MSLSPNEANPPLVVDADRMLAAPILAQRFQSVAGRDPKIVERPSVIDEAQLPQPNRLNIWRQPTTPPTVPNGRRFRIAKAHDHDNS
jgi:hypothetical protein